jgi:heat shock protein HslJ
MPRGGRTRGRAHLWRPAAALLALGLIWTACGDDAPPPTSRAALENATYLTDLTPDGKVALIGGGVLFPRGGTIERYHLIEAGEGDLDGDEVVDAAVILVEFSGASEFIRLHALLSDGETTEDVATRFLGDRIFIEDLRISDGLIEVDMLVRRLGENPQARPTMPITRRFALTRTGLTPVDPPATREGGPRTMGAGSAATLVSHEWILETIRMGDWSQTTDSLERRPSIRFATELGDETAGTGNLSGYSGCNQFFGSYTIEEGSALKVGPLGATRRLCGEPLDDLEQRVLSTLSAATTFSVSGDRLTIEFDGGTLLFGGGAELVPPAPPGDREPRPEPGTADRSS